MQNERLTQTINFVKNTLSEAESGHDWLHAERVYKTALLLAKTEPSCNLTVVALAALLHDIADSKFYDDDETVGIELIKQFLESQQLDIETISEILFIIENLSFKNSFNQNIKKTIEFQIVQDADRLDATGAIGIARAFNYGGYKKRPFYNNEKAVQIFSDSDSYKKNTSPTINHFYEKLLKLKELMNTPQAKQIAEKRHEFMIDFLQQFDSERNGLK
ncbi:MAG: HD domain-containing protein [Lentimicrobiaceae bacterium]|jgi:uncharacterized protein|nr:HD domain-containing protein [Lentimicrobiaceae bacterium]